MYNAVSVLILLGAGCAPKAPPVAAAPIADPTAGAWHIAVPNGDPANTWVHLLKGGDLEYTHGGLDGVYQNDGTDAWSVEGAVLKITWTNGYSHETYDLGVGEGPFSGTKTSESWPGATRSCTIEHLSDR